MRGCICGLARRAARSVSHRPAFSFGGSSRATLGTAKSGEQQDEQCASVGSYE